jgi:hypothetical protein
MQFVIEQQSPRYPEFTTFFTEKGYVIRQEQYLRSTINPDRLLHTVLGQWQDVRSQVELDDDDLLNVLDELDEIVMDAPEVDTLNVSVQDSVAPET